MHKGNKYKIYQLRSHDVTYSGMLNIGRRR